MLLPPAASLPAAYRTRLPANAALNVRLTVRVSVFPDNTTYFDPSRAPFMINYIVDDLDAILSKLERNGVTIDPKREDYDYGRFAWIFDPDGNKIELWEPRGE